MSSGVLDAHHPGLAAVRLGTGGADVAADADEQPFGGVLAHPLGGVALGDGPHVETQLRVCKIHRARLLIDLDGANIGVGGGLFQGVVVGQGGGLGVLDARLPGVVPQA